MPNRNYLKGRRLEYKAKKEWEAEGFLVIRSAGSKGPFDLIAFHGGLVLAIQVKATTGGKTAVRRLHKQFNDNLPMLPNPDGPIQALQVWDGKIWHMAFA